MEKPSNNSTHDAVGTLCDLNAERAMLGAMLMERSVIDGVLAIVPSSSALYLIEHRQIFDLIASLFEADLPIDLRTFENHARTRGIDVEKLGGVRYLMELAESYSDTAHAETYAKIVRGFWQRRELWRVADHAMRAACNIVEYPEAESVAAELIRDTEQAVSGAALESVRPLWDVLEEVPAFLNRAKAQKLIVGIHAFDEQLGGIERPGVTILAARPSVGKTSLGVQFAMQAARFSKVPTLIVSVESASVRLACRVLARLTNTTIRVMRDETNPKDLEQNVRGVRQRMGQIPIYITHVHRRLDEIIRVCRAMVRKHRIGLIVVDYLQKVKAAGRFDSRNAEVTDISGQFSNLSAMTDTAILLLAQINREAVGGMEPELHNLRESGSIEQDADTVILMWANEHAENLDKERINLKVAKNRDGRLMRTELDFHKATFCFTEVNQSPEIESLEAAYVDPIPF